MTYLQGGLVPESLPLGSIGFADSPLPTFFRQPCVSALAEGHGGIGRTAPAAVLSEDRRKPNQRHQRRMRRISRRKSR